MNKKLFITFVTLPSLLIAGCSFEDLMFWKKKDDKSEETPAVYYAIQPEMEVASEDERVAILDTINYKAISYLSGDTTSPLRPNKKNAVSEDKGDNIYLVQQVIQKGDKVVNIDWEVDNSQEYFGDLLTIRDEKSEKKLIEIKYKGRTLDDEKQKPNGEFHFGVKSMTCGNTKVTDFSKLQYNVVVENYSLMHEDRSIAKINEVHNEKKVVVTKENAVAYEYPSTYDIVDYLYHEDKDSYSPYYPTNNPGAGPKKEYLYLNVPGKVIYTAPDGNWGLLADGAEVLEFYTGGGTKLLPSNFPRLSEEYVKVSGNMGTYMGNMQLGFITKIAHLSPEEKAAVKDPVLTYPAITEDFIRNTLKVEGYSGQRQAVEGLSGSLRSVTGKVILDSLDGQKAGTGSSEHVIKNPAELSDERFTFQIQVGEERMTVAYDYHVNKGASENLFEAFRSKLVNGATITVKGTMRFNGDNSASFKSGAYSPTTIKDEADFNAKKATLYTRDSAKGAVFTKADSYSSSASYYSFADQNNSAVWTIVPFQIDHIA